MSRIVFTGYYGMQNYGDDLFGAVSLYGAERWWPRYASFVHAPPAIGYSSRCSVPSGTPLGLYSMLNPAGTLLRTALLAREVMKEGRIVFSGGSLFSSDRSGSVESVISALGKHRPLSAIGVSIGPFANRASEKAVREFLARFDYVSVRDSASFAWLESQSLSAKIALGRDLAALAPLTLGTATQRMAFQSPVIGYATCNVTEDPRHAMQFDEAFIKCVSRRRECAIRLFVLNRNAKSGDQARSRYIESRLIEAGLRVDVVDYSSVGLAETWRAIASCDAMISVRLHGAITAYLSGIPFILCEYHKKCTDFLADIGQPDALRVVPKLSTSNEISLDDQIEFLLTSNCLPSVPRFEYSESARSHFLDAPWANTGVDV